MKKEVISRLMQKGWSKEDILKAYSIIEARKRADKSRTLPHMNRTLYWMTFFVIIIGNFLVSLTLIPVMLVINKLGLDLIIIFLGLAIGLLFNLLITDIEHVDTRYHITIGVAIPVIAILNFFFIVYVTDWLNKILKISIVRPAPYTVTLLYVAAFLAPFIISRIKARQ
jgi:hypothetical protein